MPNNDPRYLQIANFLDNYRGDICKVCKVPRVGMTTGTIAWCINNKKTFLLIAPTKAIAHDIIKKGVKYSEHKKNDIKKLVVLPGNHSCLIHKNMMKKYPDTATIPILPLPKKCTRCENFGTCTVPELMRTPYNKLAGMGCTYHKFIALMMSEGETAVTLQTKMENADVIIFDEAHFYETPDTVNIEVYPHIDLKRYQNIFKDNKKIRFFLNMFSELKDDLEVNIQELILNRDDAEKNRMAVDSLFYGVIEFDKVIEGLNEVIRVMKKRKKYGLSVEEVLTVFDIIMILSVEQQVLHYIKEDDGDHVILSAKDGLHLSTKVFLANLDRYKKHTVLFTSATFGDFDYTGIFGFHDVHALNDVMGSNESLIIYPDTFKLDGRNIWSKYKERVLERMIELKDKHPEIIFVTMKKRVAAMLHNELGERGIDARVDWYGSPRMIGVESKKRIGCFVGAPIKPINTYDGITNTYLDSQKRRIGNNHVLFWQAVSRFKDPAGEEKSTIYCIGIKENQVRNMCTWGVRRKLEIDDFRRETVIVEDPFPMPNIVTEIETKIIDKIKKNGSIQHNALRRKMKVRADVFKASIDHLINFGIVACMIVKGVKKPYRVYSIKEVS